MAAPAHTGSVTSRLLGVLALAGLAATAVLGLVVTEPDAEPPVGQGDSMRLLYVHVPSAILAYVAFGLTAVGSVLWLVRRSTWWDRVAASAAEVGVLFTALCLLTGSLWGRPTWGTYWDWDPRLTTTALLLLLFVGYLAIRRLPADPTVRAKRSAIVGLVAFADVPIVHFAVDWWRSLHQDATVGTLDVKLEGLQLFSFFVGLVAFSLFFAWSMLHRFRLAWLEDRVEETSLDAAIAERRAEAAVEADVEVSV
jgi:heme exporter protein C